MQRPRHEPSHRRSGRIGRAWRGLKRAGPGDCTVWGGALALAAFSIWFPWDAYVNQARYGPPTLQFSRNGAVPADVIALREGRAPLFDMVAGTYVGDPPPRDLAGGVPADPFATAAPVSEDRDGADEAAASPLGIDPITTAGVPDGDAAAHVYRLLDAGRGLALIADTEGIYIVRPGAVLPDGRRVTAVLGRGGSARIVTGDESEVRLD